MGRDKALLPFGSYDTLLEYQYERLKKSFENIYISCKNGEKLPANLPFIEDLKEIKEHSPLIGLVSVFEKLKEDSVFVLSVDAPFFSAKDFEKLYKYEKNECDAVISKEKNGKIHPLCGIYKRSIFPLLKEALSKNSHKLQEILKKANTLYVESENEKSFTNLNYPQDYENAKRILNG